VRTKKAIELWRLHPSLLIVACGEYEIGIFPENMEFLSAVPFGVGNEVRE
jgi:hypothetical protein